MEFRFTDEQLMIRDTAAAFLAEVSSSDAVRAAMATETGFDAELWQRICTELYWPAMHIPEAYGGLGLGYVELAATLEQMGRYLFCSPFLSTVCLGVNAILLAGSDAQKRDYLPGLASGQTATLAWTSPGRRWDAEAVQATWEHHDGAYLINGCYRYVLDGHTADWLILAARKPGSRGDAGISLFILPADSAGLEREWLPTVDQTRKQAALQCNQLRVPASARLGAEGRGGRCLEQTLDLARIALAAEQVGGAQRALDLSVAYAQERVQFDRTIASFQAVKHKAADMMVKAESARSAAYYAACVAQEFLTGGPLAGELAEAASVVQAWCSDACFFNAGCGIQLHGGVGFTWEYDIQLYFKRAKSSESLFGDASWHRERLAGLLLDEGVA
jgi:alkylation response protein AidB-like acyl-CoA dehydrogenase